MQSIALDIGLDVVSGEQLFPFLVVLGEALDHCGNPLAYAGGASSTCDHAGSPACVCCCRQEEEHNEGSEL